MDAASAEHENLEVATPRGPVPLGFARSGSSVFLVARAREARWPVEILRTGAAELTLPEGRAHGRVSLIVDRPERERILGLFREKYGDRLYERWYDHPARVLRVDLSAPPSGARVPPDQYYRWLADEFDNVAEDYDRHITGNRINRLLRDRSLALLRPTFSGARHLLEIGCGSGMETLPLLREGHEVSAVDISHEMLEVVRRKAAAEGLSERLRTHQLPARELPQLLREMGSGAFDGGYSTYGAFNCEPDLSAIPPTLHALLRPRSRFLTGIYNRWCVFEIAGYSLTGQFRRAWGRRSRPIPVGDSRFCVDVFAYSVGDLERLFSPGFAPERVEGVPVLLPPSDLTSYAEKLSGKFGTLARWDAWLGERYPFSHLGDHFLLLFHRVDGALPPPSASA